VSVALRRRLKDAGHNGSRVQDARVVAERAAKCNLTTAVCHRHSSSSQRQAGSIATDKGHGGKRRTESCAAASCLLMWAGSPYRGLSR
jgi:hypothetical protein